METVTFEYELVTRDGTLVTISVVWLAKELGIAVDEIDVVL